jgi:hypothetical protein
MKIQITFLVWIIAFLPAKLFAQSKCETLFAAKTSFSQIFLKDAAKERPKPRGFGFFIYDPMSEKKTLLGKTKELFKYGPRKIARWVLNDSDYRFAILNPLWNGLATVSIALDKFLLDKPTEYLSQRYLGAKKQLRLWWKIPLSILVTYYPFHTLDNYIHDYEVSSQSHYEQKIMDHADDYILRLQNDFRFLDLKNKAEDANMPLHSMTALRAALHRSQDILNYQKIRNDVQDNSPEDQMCEYLRSPLFWEAKYYIENHPELSSEKQYELVQLTNHYLVSLEVVDIFIESSPEDFEQYRTQAVLEKNQTVIELIDEIKKAEFNRIITQYYQNEILTKEEYKHYLQAFYFYRYQVTFFEVLGKYRIKDPSKPVNAANVVTHQDLLNDLILEIQENHPTHRST